MDNHSNIKSNLTQSQLLLWTGQLLNKDAPLYNMALAFELNGAIDFAHFQLAFQKMIDGADALRTVFSVEEGIPQQSVLPTYNYQLELKEWNSDQNLKEYLSNRSQKLFDTGQPMFDSVLIKLETSQYLWFFNQHHLITDGWSVAVLYKKMAALYDSSLAGSLEEGLSLPSYSAYRIYEEQEVEKFQLRAEEENYWKNQLKSLPHTPNLYGKPSAGEGSASERITITLGEERTNQLRKLTEESDIRAWTQHLALFNIFATVLISFVHRVSGQSKLSIGTPAHNRLTSDFKETAGLFIELFPLVAEIEKQETFSSLFQKMQRAAFDFLKNATPGAASSELSKGFNVVLNYINASFSDFNTIPMKSDWIHPNHADAAHVLRLQVHDFDNTGIITLHFDVNTTVFNEVLRKQIPNHFLSLLDAFISDRFSFIQKPSLTKISEELFQDQLNENLSSFEYKSVVSLFEEHVIKTPNSIVLSEGNRKLTFEEVNTQANQLAHYLLRRGLKKGDKVGIYLKRSSNLLISIFGVLKAGGSYTPIDTSYSGIRISDILSDADFSFLISEHELAKQLDSKLISHLIELDKEQDSISKESGSELNIDILENDIVYQMYTSGSTGKPKGVMIPNLALSHYLQWARSKYGISGAINAPLFTAIGFDLTVTSLFLPLISGGTVHIYEEPTQGPDLGIFRVIEENKCNLIKLTPSHLALLKDTDCSKSNLEAMLVGGEDFKFELAKSTQLQFGEHLKIYNEYGPTEATVGCIVHQFSTTEKEGQSVLIGKTIPNTTAYVLDEFLNQVPQGVAGELYLSGVGLAKGYWDQEDLTNDSFIANPFTENQLMYRTGDLVRMNGDDDLDFLGRIDEQVKISGRRIELGEIESAINRLDLVKTSVVELRKKDNTARTKGVTNCSKCGLPSSYPNIEFDNEHVCTLCNSFESYQARVKQYFKTTEDLKHHFKNLPENREYDCIALLSGGKDSTYVLAQLVEMGLKVLAFTLDNGYISEQAKANVRRIVKQLGVDHMFGETPAMNEVFVDSLKTFSNVCDGCFKVIYTLSMNVALEKNIPYIVTGLSRGQFFETRLTEELFEDDKADLSKIDQIILDARKNYHRVDDAVKRLLDVSAFDDDAVFEKVQFLDFYRYTDVSLDEMLAFLDERLAWVRPTDTGRSTNCLINQAGIFIHKKERGYSNYAFPYSWDVRLGHKTRDASLEEINEEIDEVEVNRILDEIGYTEEDNSSEEISHLVAYYVSEEPIEDRIIRDHLEALLPDYMIPIQFIHLTEMPLSNNGKVNKEALPIPDTIRPITEVGYVAPRSDIEEMLAQIWSEVLQIEKIGVFDKFLEIGGTSLAAIRIISRANEAFELALPLDLAFNKPTIAAFAEFVRETIMRLLENMDSD